MPLQFAGAVAVTATTEVIRGVLRIRANDAYCAAMVAAGTRPYVLPVMDAANADSMLHGMDGILLTGGEDIDARHFGAEPHRSSGEPHDSRDAFELALVRAAHARRLPTLAICRGLQLVNVALGGTLVQDLPSEWPNATPHDGDWPRSERVHGLRVQPESRLANALGASTLRVNSFHHQAIGRIAPGVRAVAHAPDGVIEGVEWPTDDWWMVGVQWHPEELALAPEPWDRALFAAFGAAMTRG